MDARGLGADEQRVGDLAVRAPFGDEREHLAFPIGEPEPVDRRVGGPVAVGLRHRRRRDRDAPAPRSARARSRARALRRCVRLAQRFLRRAGRPTERSSASASRKRAYASRYRRPWSIHTFAAARQGSGSLRFSARESSPSATSTNPAVADSPCGPVSSSHSRWSCSTHALRIRRSPARHARRSAAGVVGTIGGLGRRDDE